MHFFQGPFDEVSNWLSYHNFDFINLNSTIYITTPHKVAWSKLVVSALSSGGSDILGLSDGISTVRPEIEIESFNTTHVCVSRIPCSGRRSIRPRGLQIALYPVLRLQKTTRFRWHQVDSSHDRYQSTQRNNGHGGYNTNYNRHVLESRHSNIRCFLQEVRLTKPALYWKWSQFHSHCQVSPTPSWKELPDKLHIQLQLHGSLQAQDHSDVLITSTV